MFSVCKEPPLIISNQTENLTLFGDCSANRADLMRIIAENCYQKFSGKLKKMMVSQENKRKSNENRSTEKEAPAASFLAV